MLYRVALSYLKDAEDAKDAVHDAFVKYIRKSMTFTDKSKERAWLIRVTVNRSKDILRKRKGIVVTALDEIIDMPAENKSSEILDTLYLLDEKYRIAVSLHYLEGFSVSETASVLNISESAVKMRLARGRQMLREILEKGDSDV